MEPTQAYAAIRKNKAIGHEFLLTREIAVLPEMVEDKVRLSANLKEYNEDNPVIRISKIEIKEKA